MKLVSLTLALALAALGTMACSSAPEEEAVGSDEAEGELSAAGQAVVGAYVNEASGALQALVIKADGTFFADVDNGIRCVRAPCPATTRVTGTVKAGKKTVTLKANEDLEPTVASNFGRFYYTLSDPNLPSVPSLTLTKGANTQVLTVKTSYCAANSDCYGQSMIVPACFPLSFTCVNNACNFRCSPPPMDMCIGLDQTDCLAKPSLCKPKFGPSSCTPGPNPRCTRDMVYKSCERK